ncbi:MAG TPA: sulfatase [Phycisphaerae bacterium]|nr:sulfatase [Phycisphaerae bacterium]
MYNKGFTRREFLKRLGIGAAAVAAGGVRGAAAATGKRKPNVLFILADDLGWRDTSLYGSRFYETPNIDALAKRGVMFTQAYAANPLCSPTRASIMTGLYPARIGITTPACHLKQEVFEQTLPAAAAPHVKALTPASATRLRQEYFTLAEALQAAGYATGHFGKWHLGHEPYDPLHQGFEVDFPHWPGPGPAGSYVAPWRFPKLKGAAGEHIEDRVGQEVVKFIRAHKDRPFFASYWCFSVHSPYDAKKQLVEKYAAKADPNNPQRHPVMGAMIQSLDENVGRVVAALDEAGLADDTILVFFSDNGGVHWGGNQGEGNRYDCPITSNSPLRGGKATIYEGGTREPMIVIWPGVTKPGTKSDALVGSIDFHPTILDMLHLAPRPGQQFDGMSIVPALKGRPLGRDTVFCHFPHYVKATGNLPATYVRKGDWKLIRFYADGPKQADRFELYDLGKDLGEASDLAAAMPEKVEELNALIDRHLKDIGAVVPKPNPRYSPRAAESVAGWKAAGTCGLSAEGGRLVVTSTGGDPHVFTSQVPAATGAVGFGVRMKCATAGGGQVFWTTDRAGRFHRERSVTFPIAHDGQWHDYDVKLPAEGRLTGVRLDPGTAPGRIEIEWLRLSAPDGKLLTEWRAR